MLKVSFPLMHAVSTNNCELMIKAQSSQHSTFMGSISTEVSGKFLEGDPVEIIVDDFPILGEYQQKLTRSSEQYLIGAEK